jgi:hypothetical protein
MICLLPIPSLVAGCAAGSPILRCFSHATTRRHPPRHLRIQSGCLPLFQLPYCEEAIPTSSCACSSFASWRITNEASRRLWRTIRQIHPATLARSVDAVGSPKSCSGASDRRTSVSGRLPDKNLVRLDPQSKRFFCGLECGPLIAAGEPLSLSGCRKDRAAAAGAQAPLRQKVR